MYSGSINDVIDVSVVKCTGSASFHMSSFQCTAQYSKVRNADFHICNRPDLLGSARVSM